MHMTGLLIIIILLSQLIISCTTVRLKSNNNGAPLSASAGLIGGAFADLKRGTIAGNVAGRVSMIGTIPEELRKKIEKMSDLSLQLLNDAIEAFLRKDYYLADSIVDKSESIGTIEGDIITFIDKEKNPRNYNNIYVKLILEHIRRTAEYSFDIAEAAMNQIVGEVIEIR